MVRSKEGKQLELLKLLSNDFPEITLDKNDIDSINRRRVVDILIANKDIEVVLNTLEQLGLDKGVLGKDILAKIHTVSNDVLYAVKGLYFRTYSKVRPEVFLATYASLLVDNVGIAELSSVMRRTLETEVANAEKVAAKAAEKERETQMENNEQQEQPTIVIDLNNLSNPIRMKDINEVADRWIEELREERNAADELKENVEETLNGFKDSLNDLKEETINRTQESFNKLKEAREKKEEEKKQEETSSIWLKLAIGAATGVIVGVGIWAYKKYFEE